MEPNKDLRVSTMTLVSEINSNINLSELYKNLEINDSIRYIEYGKDRIKGTSIKKIKNPLFEDKDKHSGESGEQVLEGQFLKIRDYQLI